MTRFSPGQPVVTEYGDGLVTEVSQRRILIGLADGQTINLVVGTPGYHRVQASYCEWYAMCDHVAVGQVAHPMLGKVPTCQRCADRHGLAFIHLQGETA